MAFEDFPGRLQVAVPPLRVQAGRREPCEGTAQLLRRAWESENEPGVLHVAKTANLWLRFSPLLTPALARALEEAARPGLLQPGEAPPVLCALLAGVGAGLASTGVAWG